jgi:adenylate cyclase
MARNVEIKARIESVDAIAATVAAMADRGPFELQQDDTFFACERGRVKLRACSTTEGELIFSGREGGTCPRSTRPS